MANYPLRRSVAGSVGTGIVAAGLDFADKVQPHTEKLMREKRVADPNGGPGSILINELTDVTTPAHSVMESAGHAAEFGAKAALVAGGVAALYHGGKAIAKAVKNRNLGRQWDQD